MRRSVKYFSSAALAVLMFANRASAQAVHAAQTADEAEKKSLASNFPVAVGDRADGVRLPFWENGKQKTMFFNVDVLERKDVEHIEMKHAKITTYDKDNQIDLVLLLSFSTFDLKTRLLTTDRPFVLKRSDFEMTGDALELNTATKEGTARGNIKMTIYNFQEATHS